MARSTSRLPGSPDLITRNSYKARVRVTRACGLGRRLAVLLSLQEFLRVAQTFGFRLIGCKRQRRHVAGR